MPTEKIQQASADPRLAELSTSELLEGILLFLGDEGFSEQDVYRFFSTLETENEALAGRFRVKGVPPHQSSEPLRKTLSFFAMGKILEMPQPNPVVQYYRARSSQLQSLRKNLCVRQVLPAQKTLLQSLADEFHRSLPSQPGARQRAKA